MRIAGSSDEGKRLIEFIRDVSATDRQQHNLIRESVDEYSAANSPKDRIRSNLWYGTNFKNLFKGNKIQEIKGKRVRKIYRIFI